MTMPTEPTQQPTPSAPAPEPAPLTLTQAELDRIVGERLARERAKFSDYDDMKAKANRLNELEAANQTEAEKLRAAAEAAEKRAAEAESARDAAALAQLRTDVAVAKGLPLTLAQRLQGATREELEGDADTLLSTLAPARQAAPSFDQGARTAVPAATTVASGADLYAQRNKKT